MLDEEKMAKGFDFLSVLPLVLIFAVMYFLVIRPQNKKAKVHQEMLTTLKKGDRVITTGGLIGTITKVLDQEIILQIADKVEVHVSRAMISNLAKTTENASENKDEKGPSSEKMLPKKPKK